MATDYDAPRKFDADELGDTEREFTGARAAAQSGSVDADEDALAGLPELLGADLSEISVEDLTMTASPKQHDEFICTSCLVQHRSRRARPSDGRDPQRLCPGNLVNTLDGTRRRRRAIDVLNTESADPTWSTPIRQQCHADV